MPATIQINERPLTLSDEFTYKVLDGSDTVYFGQDQGVDGVTNEGSASAGEWLPKNQPLFVVAVGTASLAQFSHDEIAEKPKEKKERKPKEKDQLAGSFPEPTSKLDDPKPDAKKSDEG